MIRKPKSLVTPMIHGNIAVGQTFMKVIQPFQYSRINFITTKTTL